MILFPRFQLAEIEDQPWCPSWLREYSHAALAQMWQTTGANRTSSTAAQACDILLANLPEPSSFTFIDACAGAGGPTPILEEVLNQKLRAQGEKTVRFVLTDLYPDLEAWEKIVKRNENITFVKQPVDATKTSRYAEDGKKECRIFNLCFHHFDDEGAAKVLRSAVQSSDAFVIFEMTQRNLSALLNTTIVILSPLLTTLLWYWNSPVHMLFTYLIPIVPIFFAVDGYVSCIRTRTEKETSDLLERQKGDLNLKEWEFSAGSQLVLPPFGNLYYYIGVKKSS